MLEFILRILSPKAKLPPRSPAWEKFRDKFLFGKKCAACGTKANLEAHHMLPLLWGGIELDENNLIALCRYCHFVIGHLGNWSSYNPNVISDAAQHLAKVLARPTKKL